jgi:hypothetical protein
MAAARAPLTGTRAAHGARRVRSSPASNDRPRTATSVPQPSRKRESRPTPPRVALLGRTSTLPAAEPGAAAPRRLQKSTPPGVSGASAGEQTRADVSAAPGPLAHARLGPLPASKFRERTGARFRPEGAVPADAAGRSQSTASARAPASVGVIDSSRTRSRGADHRGDRFCSPACVRRTIAMATTRSPTACRIRAATDDRNRPDPSVRGVGSARLLLSLRCLCSCDRNGDEALVRVGRRRRGIGIAFAQKLRPAIAGSDASCGGTAQARPPASVGTRVAKRARGRWSIRAWKHASRVRPRRANRRKEGGHSGVRTRLLRRQPWAAAVSMLANRRCEPTAATGDLLFCRRVTAVIAVRRSQRIRPATELLHVVRTGSLVLSPALLRTTPIRIGPPATGSRRRLG